MTQVSNEQEQVAQVLGDAIRSLSEKLNVSQADVSACIASMFGGSAPLTELDLRSGKRARVTEKECEQITGRTRSSLRRDRVIKKGMPFQKDVETGRVWYAAEDVLQYLDRKKHRSTSEYDTSKQVLRLEKAREIKQSKRSN